MKHFIFAYLLLAVIFALILLPITLAIIVNPIYLLLGIAIYPLVPIIYVIWLDR